MRARIDSKIHVRNLMQRHNAHTRAHTYTHIQGMTFVTPPPPLSPSFSRSPPTLPLTDILEETLRLAEGARDAAPLAAAPLVPHPAAAHIVAVNCGATATEHGEGPSSSTGGGGGSTRHASNNATRVPSESLEAPLERTLAIHDSVPSLAQAPPSLHTPAPAPENASASAPVPAPALEIAGDSFHLLLISPPWVCAT